MNRKHVNEKERGIRVFWVRFEGRKGGVFFINGCLF